MTRAAEPPFVLVADDDAAARAALRDALRLAGAQVTTCPTVRVAVDGISFHLPSVVVVRAAMEGGRGWEVVRAARAQGSVPVVVLDGEGAPARRAAFAAGADEVMSPTRPDELATRVVALAGRVQRRADDGAVFRRRGLVMDVAAHTVRLHGRRVDLTAQQFAILRALFEANGAALERGRLVARIESLDAEPPSVRAIDLHVARLRRRLGDDARAPRYVESVYGIGYRLAAAGDDAPAELHEQAEDVLLGLADPLLVVDGAQRVRFANHAAARFLARDRGAIVGARCADVLGCEDAGGASLDGPRCYARMLSTGGATLRDAPARIRCGEDRVDVDLTYARVAGDGLTAIGIRPRTRSRAVR